MTILITDDEKTFIQKFKLMFKMLGIQGSVKDYQSSQSLLPEFDPTNQDRIFLDLNIKGSEMDGLQLAKHLKQGVCSECEIIMISTSDGSRPYTGSESSFSGLTEMESAKKVGVSGWIVKGGMDLKDRLKAYFEDTPDHKSAAFKVYS